MGSVGGASILLLLIATPATPQELGGITWQQSSYSVALVAGTVQTVTLSFTASQPVLDGSVFVTPSISGLLSIASLGNGTIPAGQMVDLAATVSVPLATPTGTYEGTLHVRSGFGTVAAPLPVTIQVVAPSADVVPTQGALPSPDRIATTSDGMQYVKDEIDVILKEDTVSPDQRIEQIASSTGGVIIGYISALPAYQLEYYQISTPQALEAMASAIRQMPDVVNALTYGIPSLSVVPNDPCAWGSGLSPCSASTEYVGELNRWGFDFVNAPFAWDIQTGSRAVVVGVIDVDMDAGHPDLVGNIQAAVFSSRTPAGGHGTHVSGTIGAVGNNGIGVAGMAWQTSLRLYDFGNVPGGLPVLMEEAANDGARIVNISAAYGANGAYFDRSGALQGCSTYPPDPFSQFLLNNETIWIASAIEWAQNHQKDVLWVFAAGNGCTDAEYATPANLTGVFPDGLLNYGAIMTVASVGSGATTLQALGPGGNLSAFSNSGPDVTVAAPGEMIYSTLPGVCIFGLCNYASAYGFDTGTSMAAPQVAGLAALVLSQYPFMSASQVKQCIVNATTLAGLPVSGQPFGVINAKVALVCPSGPILVN